MSVVVACKELGLYTIGFETRATPKAVYSYLVDFKRHKEWDTRVKAVQDVSCASLAPGCQFRKIVGHIDGWRAWVFGSESIDCTFVSIERPNQVVWTETTTDSEGWRSTNRLHFNIRDYEGGSHVERCLETYKLPAWVIKLQERLIPADKRESFNEAMVQMARKDLDKVLAFDIANMERVKDRLDKGAARGYPRA